MRNGEVLYDFTEGTDEDGEATGGYPDGVQDGVYTSTGKFNATDVLPFTATEKIMQIDAAMENGELLSPMKRRALREYILGTLYDMQRLHIQRRVVYRKTSVHKHAEPKEAWAPENRELYLELCQQLGRRADKAHRRIPSKAVEGQRTAPNSDGTHPSSTGTSDIKTAIRGSRLALSAIRHREMVQSCVIDDGFDAGCESLQRPPTSRPIGSG